MSESEYASRSHPIEEDMRLQRRVWRFERVGWAVLLLIVALTLAGLFSKGPLSSVQVSTKDGSLTVKYERFSRYGAQDDMVITSIGAPGKTRDLVLGKELLAGASIEGLNPQPEPTRSDGGDLVVPMKADARGVATLYLTVRSNGVGLFKGHAQLLGGQELPVPKFIYP